MAHLEEEEEDIPSLAAALTKEERVDGGDMRKTHAILLVGAALRQVREIFFYLKENKLFNDFLHQSGNSKYFFLQRLNCTLKV